VLTPIRRQYLAIKKQHPDAILFFRLGDFYETFDEDARLVSRELDIVLTGRPMGKGQRVPLAGIPYHAADNYIARLINKGYKVAICEQMQEPSQAKGIVAREVVRVITPGTLVEPQLLAAKTNNYLAAVVLDDGRAGPSTPLRAGIAYADITTGEFAATQLGDSDVDQAVQRELARLQPAEVLLPKQSIEHRNIEHRNIEHRGIEQRAESEESVCSMLYSLCSMFSITPYEPWHFNLETAQRALLEHFGVTTLDGFGLAGMPLAVQAAGAIVQYLGETQRAALSQLTQLASYSTSQFMVLDAYTRRNLEIFETARSRSVKGSLLGVLDLTQTAMGGRLLRRWLGQPLLDLTQLTARQEAIQTFYDNTPLRTEVVTLLRQVGDLERLANRAGQRIATPRDLVALRHTLAIVPRLQEAIANCEFRISKSEIDACPEVTTLLAQAIVDDPPATLADGGVIRPGFSAELDGLHAASKNAKQWIAGLERQERARTGIKNLKVGYNKVFGYYIEVTSANLAQVPADYIRKQTLVGAERFITPDLKEYESLVLNAQERIVELETQVFRQVLDQVAAATPRLLATARALAELDVFAALAEVALRHSYVRPTLDNSEEIRIQAGRHPVVETTLSDEPFVPNDTFLSNQDVQLIVLTGPNMAGKCLRSDTLVFTDRGLMPIVDLLPEGARVSEFTEISCHVQGRQSSSMATHIYTGGRQNTIRLTTRLGYHLEGTPEHRVWVRFPDGREGWKRLAEIAVDDFVALHRQADLWGQETAIDGAAAESLHRVRRYSLPVHLDEDLAYLMGLLIGDGTLTYHDSFLLSTADTFIADEFRRIVQRLFGYQAGCKANGKDYYVTSKQIRLFLASLGLGYNQAHEKSVPRAILCAPRHIVVAFLQGLFDTDGYTENRYGNVHLSTSSRRLAQEVQLLLLNLGFIASLHAKQTKAKPSYQLSIYGADAIAFYKSVGFRLPRKQEQQKLASSIRMPNIGGIPYLKDTLKQIQARIVATANKPVALKRDKSINSIFYTYIPTNRNISYNKLDELVVYCQHNGVACPELEDLQAQRYFYDRVVATEPGEADVYDLSVPGDHAYVANGFVSHNSTYLRQVALIILMAQIGSFVPAEKATIGLVDRIFTRVGAQDDIATGQSTFMVEMVETANILHHATRRSLIILDEIGRGTSTYDGLAIARAVVEFIHNHPRLGAKTLFATHYHELTELARVLPRVRNFNVAVAEEGDRVVFLRRIVPGGADRSYGIHVAQLAGLPRSVIHRAEEVLENLEKDEKGRGRRERLRQEMAAAQLSLFPSGPHPVVEELQKLDVDSLSPLEALTKLYELQEKAKGGTEG